MTTQCISCKGKGLCGRTLCPIIEKFNYLGNIQKLSNNIFGASPPSVFIGRYGYPDVSAGPLVPPDVTEKEAHIYDDPSSWNQLSIGDIIGLRSTLVRSNMHFKVTDAKSPDIMLQKSQELSISDRPVDTEVWFRKAPHLDLRFDGVLSPMGPAGEVIKLDIAQNPVVPRQVDKIVYDTDAKAVDAVDELYRSDISMDQITRLLSIGLLGKERKLVPTRWSITATDDMIGKMLLDEIRYFPEVNDIQVYSGSLHGNHFEIMIFPGSFAFELIEIWLPKAVWSGGSTTMEADREDFKGKKGYSNLGGGYYAARLPVLEHLTQIRHSASVFAIREIRPEYWAPLGVWVVREAARQAMLSAPVHYDSIEDALVDMSSRLNTKIDGWRHISQVLDRRMNQKTLTDFL
ncbi:MAG: hypothetical protein IBX40_00155 [Methanosarcinales archaeon]|nr:hypothetical protein [Methanosarcinales archaeon]